MPKPEQQPRLYLIAGPNGAGKTTFARQVLPALGVSEFLNADSIAAGLSPLNPALASVRAARLLLSRWRELVTDRRTFGFESTLSGKTYAAMLRTAKEAGYRIQIYYLALESVQISIRRVKERVRKGGHDVPLMDLKRRFRPSLDNFLSLYRPLDDEAILYDATLPVPIPVVTWQSKTPVILEPDLHERILKNIKN